MLRHATVSQNTRLRNCWTEVVDNFGNYYTQQKKLEARELEREAHQRARRLVIRQKVVGREGVFETIYCIETKSRYRMYCGCDVKISVSLVCFFESGMASHNEVGFLK